MTSVGGLPIDDSVFFKLVRLVNLTARPFVETIGRAHRLSLNEWRIVLVLASHPHISAQEVAWHTGLDKMNVSRALASLVRQGRVLRRDDAADKRRSKLALSAAGRRVYEKVGPGGEARRATIFAVIDEAERTQLERTLDKLTAALLAADTRGAARTRTG